MISLISFCLIFVCILSNYKAKSIAINLSAETVTSSSGSICPQATFKCSAVNLPSLTLFWFFNDTPVAQYDIAVVGEDMFMPPPPDIAEVVIIEIVNASRNGNDSANFVSTLRTTIPMLMATGITNITCGSISNQSNAIHLNYRTTPPPSPFSLLCSLESYNGNASLLWSPDPQNSADVYHIQVSPEPSPACPREVRPGETYNCSGLHLGEQYTVTVNASNCNGTQHSTTMFQVHPDALSQLLTATNKGLIGVGVFMLVLAIMTDAFVLILFLHKKVSKSSSGKFSVKLNALCFQVLLLLLYLTSLILWICLSAHVASQRDMSCNLDSDWQSSRDRLTITSFTFSLTSSLLSFLAAFLFSKQLLKKAVIENDIEMCPNSSYITRECLKKSEKSKNTKTR